MSKKFELTQLELDEVSAVDVPANKGSRVVLLKNEKNGVMMTQLRSLMDRLNKVLGEDGTEDPMPADDKTQKTDPKVAELEKNLKNLTLQLGLNDQIAKAADLAALTVISETVTKAEFDEAVAKDLNTRVDARKAELTKKTADAAVVKFRNELPVALQVPFDSMTADERAGFMKSYTPTKDDPVAKALTDIANQNKELMKKLNSFEEDASLSKAKADLADLEGMVNVEETAKAYLALVKTDKPAADRMIEQLRSVSKQAKQGGLFKVLGRDANGDENDAVSKMDKAAAELRKDDPTLTKEQAVAKALENDPSLYNNYVTESQASA